MSQVTALVPAAAANRRIRAIHSVAATFPEVVGLNNHPVVSLQGFQQPGSMVPQVMPSFVMERAFLEEFLFFASAASPHMFTLTGPTGCGKSERVRQFYARLNVPVLQMSCTRDTRMWHILGTRDLTAAGTTFVPGLLYKGMKYGYPVILDEVYRLQPSITSKFHTVRDHGEIYIEDTGETLVAAPGFKLIMTANQTGFGDFSGNHPGDAEQDMAFLNGTPSFECGYPAADIETEIVQRILEASTPLFKTDTFLQSFAPTMVAVANDARAAFGSESSVSRFELPFSTRQLVQWAEWFLKFRQIMATSGDTNPLYRALDFVLARRGTPATRLALDSFVQLRMGQSRIV
jgi:hypothetical protein